MNDHRSTWLLPLVASLAICSATCNTFTASAAAQAGTASSAAPSIPLTPYTAPDQSASAGVPAGWTVVKGEGTAIQMTGPNGEAIFLGYAAVARNAPFQAGQRMGGGIDMSMPYSATLAQKLTMILQHGAALNGKPVPQVALNSGTPISVPPFLGQCGRFVATAVASDGTKKFMGAICSLPVDRGGIYKNQMILAQAPEAIATQTAPIAKAVFASYHVPLPMLQKKFAPFTPAPVVVPSFGGGGGGGGVAIPGMNDPSAECFDLEVLRETPNYRLPRKCGGEAPND